MYVFDFALIPESMETAFEFVNLILALAAAYFSFKVAALVQGGKMESVWNLVAAGVGAFALVEVYGGLKMTNVLHVGGLGDILEFFMVVFFLIAFYKGHKILLKSALGK